MPRRYRLGVRAAQFQATRERIVEAAIELYTDVGISAATMRGVAQRADVASGTLRNHFRSRDEIESAMVERLTAEAPLPELAIFEGARTVEERLGRLIAAGGTFVDQSARLYRMWLRERMLSGVWAETGAAYGARWDALMRAALGPLADDPDAMAILRAVVEPTFFEHVRAGSRSTAEASALIAAAIGPWYAARGAEVQRDGAEPRDDSLDS